MTIIICIVAFVALFTWSMCRVASDADKRTEEFMREKFPEKFPE